MEYLGLLFFKYMSVGVFVFLGGNGVIAYKEGLNPAACSNMHPYHWYFNETHVLRVDEGKHDISDTERSPAPFIISTNSTTYDYKSSTPIEVTIEGSSFRGFYMMAIQSQRKADDPASYPYGTFIPLTDNEKAIPCNLLYGGISHTNNKDKDKIKVLWLPPIEYVGNIHFVATVAKNFYSFWTNVQSMSVSGDQRTIPYHLYYFLNQANPEWDNAPNWMNMLRWFGMYGND